ncbi:MAG TPA: hypothetical protein VGL06_14555 [Pseudonocardiaceae bacterium]
MNPDGHAATTLARLLAVDWRSDDGIDHPRARAKLMREYLRRAAWWARELGATDAWPFFDIPALWAPDVEVPRDLLEPLETLISTGIGWPSVATTVRAALRWAAVLDAGKPVPDGLADPYAPLLLMFERGGGFTTEHGFIDLGAASVRQQTWEDHLTAEQIVPLTRSALDALDPV